MGKKHTKPVKDKAARFKEVETMKHKLRELGLTPEISEIGELFNKLDDFVAVGYSESVSTKLPGLKRIIKLNLCMRPQTESNLTLQYSEHV